MNFDSDIGDIQRRLALTQEGFNRRKAAFEGLDVDTNKVILDLGCGGGHLIKDLALAVGPEGKAIGIDQSEQQIHAAKDFCRGMSNVEFYVGSGTSLPFENEYFDSVSSIQVLEYIDDVDNAIAEIGRVIKPGGRFANVSVLWDHWRFHGPDPVLNDEIHKAFKKHCYHQMLPLSLTGILRRYNFAGIQHQPLGFLNRNLHYNSFARLASKLIIYFAEQEGVDRYKTDLWKKQLEKAEREGRFGFVSVPVLTTATSFSNP